MSANPTAPALISVNDAVLRPTRDEALKAVRTLLAWAGDNPDRPGLIDHCEHHMAPFIGKAYVAYIPRDKVVGISKLARVVEIFSRRLQTQETLTQLIAGAIESNLQPAGVAIMIDAEHQCMTTRGVHHRHVSTITTRFTGAFKTDVALKDRFLALAKG